MSLENVNQRNELSKRLAGVVFSLLLATYGIAPHVALAQVEPLITSLSEEEKTSVALELQQVTSWEQFQQLFGENNIPEGLLAATTIYESQEVLEACNKIGVTLDDQQPGIESSNFYMATSDQVKPASGSISYVIPENSQMTFSRIDLEPFVTDIATQKVYFLLHLAKNELNQQGGVLTVHVFAKDAVSGASIPYYSAPISLDGFSKGWQTLVVGINLGESRTIQSAGVIINRTDTATVLYADAISLFADNPTEACDLNVYVPFAVNHNYDSPTLVENSPYFQWSDWRDTPENREFVFTKLPLTESDRVQLDGHILFNTQALSIAIATESGPESIQLASIESAKLFWAELIESFQAPTSAAGLFYLTTMPAEASASLFPTLNGGALLPSAGTIDLSAFTGTMARFIPLGSVALAPFLLGGSTAEFSVHSNYLLLPWGQFELRNFTDRSINDLLSDYGSVVPLHTSMLNSSQAEFLTNNGALLEINESASGKPNNSWLFVPSYLAAGYEFATPFTPDLLSTFITNDTNQTLFSYQLSADKVMSQETMELRIMALQALIEEMNELENNPALQQELIVRTLGMNSSAELELPELPQRPPDMVGETDENGIARDGQGIPDEIDQQDRMGAVVTEGALRNRQKINEKITTALEGKIALNQEQQAKLDKIANTTTRDVGTLETTIEEIKKAIQAGEELIAKEGDTEYARLLREYLDKYLPRLEVHKEILKKLQDWRDLLNSGKTPQP